jgi:uncharacterized membrane protein YuzA (DUF378 family)
MATTTPNTVSRSSVAPSGLNAIDWLAQVLMIVGAINWGLVGLANFDLVAAIFGQGSMLSRIVYSLVGLAGLYAIITLIKMANRGSSH